MPTLPAIQFPLIGNSLVVGLFSLLHIALAGLSVGFMVLAPIFEWRGTTNAAATALAHTMTRFTVVVFSVSTVLAVIMVELMIGLFPVTTMWMWNQFRGPIVVGIVAFVLQLLTLYPYYHYWDSFILRRPSLHLALGATAALFMLVWVLVLDGMGSYMLTPVERAGSWANLVNPTWLPLAFHRLIGDVLIAGYVIAAYGAWRTGRPADQPQRAYYVYVSQMGWTIGLVTLLLQPFSGLFYAWAIRSSVPDAYEQLILGPYQLLVYVQFLLIGLLFIGNHLVLRAASPTRPRWIDALVVTSAIALVASVSQTTFRRTVLFLLVALMLWGLARLWSKGRMVNIGGGMGIRPVMAGLGVIAVLTYLTMGIIRETARRPDTVRNMISLQDEAKHPAAFRKGQGPNPEDADLRTEQRK